MIEKRQKILKIPGAEEWSGWKEDLSAREAHSSWFGKSLEDMQPLFGSPIQRAQELLYMPRAAYQFYIFAFAQFVMSDAAIGDADAASCFLGNLIAREKRDAGSVADVFARLETTIDFVAASQARFDADHDVYGDFAEKAEALRKLLGVVHSPSDPQDQMLDSTDDA